MSHLPHPHDLFADNEARVVRELRAAQLLQQARLHRESLAAAARQARPRRIRTPDLRRRLAAALTVIGTWLAPEPCLEPCPERIG